MKTSDPRGASNASFGVPSLLPAALRAARGSESLREVQGRTGISDSALSAYERGARMPAREFLEILDRAYEQHGGLLAHARLDTWSPKGLPTTTHRWTIPAAWVGPVWCTVRGAAGPVAMLFRWGPWGRRVDQPAPKDSADQQYTYTMVVNRFDTGAVDDRVLTCETSEPSWVFWATGQPGPELAASDISEGWYPHEKSVLMRLAGQLLLDALAHTGRSTAELAEFLGVDVEVIDALGGGIPLGSQALGRR